MSDLISGQAAIDAVLTFVVEYCGAAFDDDLQKMLCERLEAVPSADRPQGEWLIEKTIYDNYNYRCSNCDWYECHAYPDNETYNFCPNCGARMRGESDE